MSRADFASSHSDSPSPETEGIESPEAVAISPDITATAPGKLKVIKRNGKLVPYDDSKIGVAINKAFLDVGGSQALQSAKVRELIMELTHQISDIFHRRLPSGGAIDIEEIQDQVELALMRGEHHKVARSYVLYREARRLQREAEEEAAPGAGRDIDAPPGAANLEDIARAACEGLEGVDAQLVLKRTMSNLYEGISEDEMFNALTISARELVEQESNYSFVAARLLLHQLRIEAMRTLGVAEGEDFYPRVFAAFIERGVELELLDPRLKDNFDLPRLAETLDAERDLQFGYLGLQTLYDRYFIHTEERRIELPQSFFMRVAMGLALEEDDPNARAIEFYKLLSSFDYMSSTPTLFNAGTLHSQLSSCYLTSVPDNLRGIFGAIHDNAMLSKWSGGLGNDWTPVRALNSNIKGTNGKSQGVVPFLKVANDTAVAVNQGGKRKGALCSYLETWHLDVEEFLTLRKNTGDERRRTHDMHTANWVPDLFFKRLDADAEWTLFSPNDTPDLHDLIGRDFEKRYEEYERMADKGELKLFKRVKAADLWRQMVSSLYETGHPWITFKDSCNLRSPQQHEGVIHSSNLCTEITLNTKPNEEIAVCNLGSVNLSAHVGDDGELDLRKLERTITTAMRMLDNVIDINYYSVETAKHSNARHRPVGLGLMGFQDALYKKRIPYSSAEAVEFADRSMEAISYYAIQASCALADERGSYQSFKNSLWQRGILPIDSIAILKEHRGEEYLQMDESSTMDWDALRKRVKRGMRNSNVMAIAPTATISNIVGVSQSIEPTFANLYTKSNLSGEFTVINQALAEDLKKIDLWDEVMVNDIKYYDGSLRSIDRVPDDIKALYATAFEVDAQFIVQAASRRQKWLDQSQSLNIYIDHEDGNRISMLYRLAWQSGLKTTYYLRSLGATSVEKSSLQSTGALSAVPTATANGAVMAPAAANGAAASAANGAVMAAGAPPPAACRIDDPDCEACQ